MVFTVSNKDNGLAHLLVLSETIHRKAYGLRYIRALGGYERGVSVLQEHLGRHIVAGDGQLHIGVTGKNHKSYLVVGEVVHEILHEHLALVKS